jgi:hypothetical protein
MIKRIIQWLKETKAWKKEHIKAWEGFYQPGTSGVTLFQEQCLTLFRDNIQSNGIIEKSGSEKYYTGKIEGTNIAFYIYEDGAELNGADYKKHLEKWGFETPTELIIRFIELCKEVKQFNKTINPTGR